MSAVFLLLGPAAFAGGEAASVPPKAQPKVMVCMADVERFCSNVQIGNGRRIACLAKHQKQLAPLCQRKVPIMQAMFEYGQQQHKRTQEHLAEQEAAAKQKAATDGKTAKPPATPAPDK